MIRLDASTKDGFRPPPARYTAALLCDAIALAAKTVRITVPGSGPRIRLRFGRELDTRPIWRQPFAATGRALDPAAVANYIAKYVTKAVDVPGLPDTRIRHASEIGALRCPAHHKRMVATAWDLGARTSVGDPRLRLWAHQLGFGGHSAHQVPPLLGHLRLHPGRTRHRPRGSSATPTANATPGAAPSTTAWSWSSPTGATPEPATRPARPALSWRWRRPTWHAAD